MMTVIICGQRSTEQIAEMEADSKRLDWLFENEACAIRENDNKGWFVSYLAKAPQRCYYPTPRWAVDAAMKESPEAGRE